MNDFENTFLTRCLDNKNVFRLIYPPKMTLNSMKCLILKALGNLVWHQKIVEVYLGENVDWISQSPRDGCQLMGSSFYDRKEANTLFFKIS